MDVFNELNFTVNKKVFYEVMENKDTGFGFKATLERKLLTELQIEVNG